MKRIQPFVEYLKSLKRFPLNGWRVDDAALCLYRVYIPPEPIADGCRHYAQPFLHANGSSSIMTGPAVSPELSETIEVG